MTDYRALCKELLAWAERTSAHYIVHPDLFARARAALAQPEPVAPTVMEIIELHSWLNDEWQANNDGEDLPVLDFARAVLARWGTPAIEPVPVSERLPGPEDYDAGGRCWCFNPVTFAGGIFWWSFEPLDYAEDATHWLPHWALPVPANTTKEEI